MRTRSRRAARRARRVSQPLDAQWLRAHRRREDVQVTRQFLHRARRAAQLRTEVLRAFVLCKPLPRADQLQRGAPAAGRRARSSAWYTALRDPCGRPGGCAGGSDSTLRSRRWTRTSTPRRPRRAFRARARPQCRQGRARTRRLGLAAELTSAPAGVINLCRRPLESRSGGEPPSGAGATCRAALSVEAIEARSKRRRRRARRATAPPRSDPRRTGTRWRVVEDAAGRRWRYREARLGPDRGRGPGPWRRWADSSVLRIRHRDRHRTDAAGHRRDPRGAIRGRANSTSPTSRRRHAVHADVDYDRARPDPLPRTMSGRPTATTSSSARRTCDQASRVWL